MDLAAVLLLAVHHLINTFGSISIQYLWNFPNSINMYRVALAKILRKLRAGVCSD